MVSQSYTRPCPDALWGISKTAHDGRSPVSLLTLGPTLSFTLGPTLGPTLSPTLGPTLGPTLSPTLSLTAAHSRRRPDSPCQGEVMWHSHFRSMDPLHAGHSFQYASFLADQLFPKYPHPHPQPRAHPTDPSVSISRRIGSQSPCGAALGSQPPPRPLGPTRGPARGRGQTPACGERRRGRGSDGGCE